MGAMIMTEKQRETLVEEYHQLRRLVMVLGTKEVQGAAETNDLEAYFRLRVWG